MIRNKSRSDIIVIINNHKQFIVSDFDIELKNETSLFIKYAYDEKYYFQVTFPRDVTRSVKENRLTHKDELFEEYNFKGSVSPGRVAITEKLEFDGEPALHSKLKIWLDCLWEELMAIPVNRQQAEFDSAINEIKDKIKDIPDEYFSKSEGDAIKTKLDELEKRFHEKLEKEILNKEELKSKFDELHQEFLNLKATILSLKKKGWFKSLAIKTFSWALKDENRKFLKDAKDFIQPMLPEGVKDLLP